jgi:hypothetical protein
MFSISFNGALLKDVKPSTYKASQETIRFPVKTNGDGKLRFCSIGGANNAEGAVLKSASLVRISSPQ